MYFVYCLTYNLERKWASMLGGWLTLRSVVYAVASGSHSITVQVDPLCKAIWLIKDNKEEGIYLER